MREDMTIVYLASVLRNMAKTMDSKDDGERITAGCLENAANELERLNAENARLREALTRIASGGLFQHAHEFARAALAGEEKKS